MDYQFLILFWVSVLGVAICVYGILDGFDLGVGMLFGFMDDPAGRDAMMAAIAPSWDGNETWLILIGTILFGAFPILYAIIFPAFYIPVLLMLVGLIFRGVAFEFRGQAHGYFKRLWDHGFWIGSSIVAFVQGAALGALLAGIPVENNIFVGNSFVWLQPFPIFCGFGLMAGYMVLGSAWLLMRGPDYLRRRALVWCRLSVAAMMVLVIGAGVWSYFLKPVAFLGLENRPMMIVLPCLWALCLLMIMFGLRREQQTAVPFLMTAASFLCAFLFLAGSFWPYMIPGSVTISQAAAPVQSLEFLFWGAGLIALPIISLYTIIIYRVFRMPISHYDQ
jgi:cytochrome bd ubiquinol oxidase subunit II